MSPRLRVAVIGAIVAVLALGALAGVLDTQWRARTADGDPVPGLAVCALREGAGPRRLWVTSLPVPADGVRPARP